MTPSILAFCTSPRFVEHEAGPHHPERPDRIRAIFAAVREAGLVESPNPFDEPGARFALDPALLRPGGPKLLELDAPRADEKWPLLLHPASHLAKIRRVCEVGGGVLDQGDTPVCPASYEIALLSLGAVLRCCDAVIGGEARRAFAAVRPPGHHAEPDRPMGFCLLSNVAIAARYLQQAHGVRKVAIVDFDVHHGNGTQACLESDPTVHFSSLHQHPRTLYPGSGYAWETGTGPGVGATLNIPLDPGGGDDEYLDAMANRVLPALAGFRPEILLISAGFDAHRDDPLAGMTVSDEGFGRMTRLLVDFAEEACGGRVVGALEGGYNLHALGRGVVRHLVAMQP